jgi:ribulose-phosphate 3-epimerase
MKLIAPSILAADLSNLSQQIRYVEIGGADWIHCDIMDGHFVPNITFGPILVRAARKCTNLPLDVHLMIENADDYIEDFIKSGAGYVTVQQEAVVHLNRTVNRIKELGAKAGIAINPSTPVDTLKETAEFTDLILIMSVNPGFGGQSFIPNTLRKVRELVKLRVKLQKLV